MKLLGTIVDPNKSNVVSVPKCFKAMSFTPNASNELRTLNCNTINMQNVFCFWNFLMETSFLDFHLCVNSHAILVKCKGWIESSMTMFGVRWRWPSLNMILDWVSKVANVWATCDVKITLVTSLLDWVLKMKSLGMTTWFKFVFGPLINIVAYKFYGQMPFCVHTCKCMIYYVVHKTRHPF
jgi:hypothetical protein